MNSNSFDKTLAQTVSFDISTPGGVRLKNSYFILKEKCMSCHTGYHSDWTKYNTDELWEQNQLVIAGDSEASELIIRMKNSGGDMPLGGSGLDLNNFEIVKEWIDNI